MPAGNRESTGRSPRQKQRRSDRRPAVSTARSERNSLEGDSSEGESETDDSESEDDEEIQPSHVLIRKGASLDGFAQLNDTQSVQSKIARSRGRAEFLDDDELQDIEADDETVSLRFEEGQLQLETDYVMHFVKEAYTDLPIYDIISIPDAPCYPVSRTTLESLPRWAQAKLERQGHLKCSGVYDRPTKKFFSVRLGWDDHPQNTADVLAELLQEYDGDRLARSVYYFLHEYASDEYSDPETIAELRGIQESSVKSEIEKADRQLEIE